MWQFAVLLLCVIGCKSGDEDEDDLGKKLPPRPRSDLVNPVDGTLFGDLTWLSEGPVIGDQDADGLPDLEEDDLGTDKNNPDTDGDALLDGWEVYGVDGTKLQDLGANPRQFDIFVEMDYMVRKPMPAPSGLAPSANVVTELVKAFLDAPVKNHDDSFGIHLHLDYHFGQPGTASFDRGGEIPHQAAIDQTKAFFLRLHNFNWEKRARTFHYMVWADTWNSTAKSGQALITSSGSPEAFFVVTLGSSEWNGGGDDAMKIGTFMHELGHDLSLEHGGVGTDLWKPNHQSVMNYAFQMTGVKKAGNFIWTYQWLDIDALDENHLNEKAGIGAIPGSVVVWYLTALDPYVEPADGKINWNQDESEQEDLKLDINQDGTTTDLGRTVNEWKLLKYNGGVIGSGLTTDQVQDAIRPQRKVHAMILENLKPMDVLRLRRQFSRKR